MKYLERALASALVLFASFMTYAADSESEQRASNNNSARETSRSRFSLRDEQADREETIYLLTGVETDEEELEILEARIEQVRERLGEGVSPDCRF